LGSGLKVLKNKACKHELRATHYLEFYILFRNIGVGAGREQLSIPAILTGQNVKVPARQRQAQARACLIPGWEKIV